jgi:hypothetical protein
MDNNFNDIIKQYEEINKSANDPIFSNFGDKVTTVPGSTTVPGPTTVPGSTTVPGPTTVPGTTAP